MEGPIARRIASGGFWSLLGAVLGKGLAMLMTVALTHMLGREKFGEYDVLMSTSLLLVFLAESGLMVTMTKFIPELLVSDKDRVGRVIGTSYVFSLIVGVLIAGFFFATSPWFCDHILKAPFLAGLMQFGGVLLIFTVLTSIQTGVLRGFQDYRGLALTETTSGALKFIFVIFGVWLDGLRGAMVGYGAALVISCFVGRWFIRINLRKHSIRCCFLSVHRELPLLYRFSLPIVFASMLVGLVFWLCDILLVHFVGFSELAIYAAARRVFLMIVVSFSLSKQVFLPLLSEIKAKNEMARFNRLLKTYFCLNVGMVCAVCMPLLLFPSWFMGTVFGQEFYNGGAVLALLCIASILAAVEDVFMSLLLIWNQTRIYMTQTAVWATCYLGGAWILLAYCDLGAFGIALTYLIALVVRLLVVIFYAKWFFNRNSHP